MAKLLWPITILLLLIFLHLSSLVLQQCTVGRDAGFFLRTAEDISKGFTLYKEMWCQYTPLALYTYAAVQLPFSKVQDVTLFFLTNISLILLNGLLLYRLLGQVTDRREVKFLGVALYCVNVFACGGFRITLEPFVTVFALIALVIVTKKELSLYQCALVGLLAACSFLSKQYGLAVLPPLLFCLYLRSRDGRDFCRKALAFFAAYACAIGFFLYYFLIIRGTEFTWLVTCLSGKGAYCAGYPPERGYFFQMMVYFFSMHLYLILLPLAFWKWPKLRQNFLYVALLFILCLGVSLLIRQYGHYYILLLPFLTLLSMAMLDRALYSKGPISLAIILLTLISVAPTIIFSVKLVDLATREKARDQQLKRARVISRAIPQGTKTVLFGDPGHHLLCNFDSWDRRGAGHPFMCSHSPETVAIALGKAGAVIVELNEESEVAPLKDLAKERGKTLKALLVSFHFKAVATDGKDLTVYLKSLRDETSQP